MALDFRIVRILYSLYVRLLSYRYALALHSVFSDLIPLAYTLQLLVTGG